MPAHKPTPRPDELDWAPLKREVPDWFRDAKFGLFFHWGPYSVPACENEWYSRNMYARGLSQNRHHVETYGPLSEFGYKDFLGLFTGSRFDPESWAELIVGSGARYAGPVTEHADNFSLWDSGVNPVNAVSYGPKRDVVGELKRAISARGIRFAATFHHQWLWGWFMSTDPDADVYDPANEIFYGKALPLETNRYIPWRLPDADFNERWMRKVVEVVDRYDPDLVYFDSRALIIDERVRMRVVEHCYHGPAGRADRVITYKQRDFPQGVGVVDIECGRFSELHGDPWQTDDRLEARRTWCHVQDPQYKPAATVIHQLCDVVSKNGNLLLNVGPRADGTFVDEAVAVLHEVGDWLHSYGEAIYETRPFSVYGEGGNADAASFDVSRIEAQTKTGVAGADTGGGMAEGDLRFTTREDVVYVIIAGAPGRTSLRINSLGARGELEHRAVSRIDVIGGAQDLQWQRDRNALVVDMKGQWPSQHANVLKVSTSRS